MVWTCGKSELSKMLVDTRAGVHLPRPPGPGPACCPSERPPLQIPAPCPPRPLPSRLLPCRTVTGWRRGCSHLGIRNPRPPEEPGALRLALGAPAVPDTPGPWRRTCGSDEIGEWRGPSQCRWAQGCLRHLSASQPQARSYYGPEQRGANCAPATSAPEFAPLDPRGLGVTSAVAGACRRPGRVWSSLCGARVGL